MHKLENVMRELGDLLNLDPTCDDDVKVNDFFNIVVIEENNIVFHLSELGLEHIDLIALAVKEFRTNNKNLFTLIHL